MTLTAQKLDIVTNDSLIALIHSKDAAKFSLSPGDLVHLTWSYDEMGVSLFLDITDTLVSPGKIGLFKDIYDNYFIEEASEVTLDLVNTSDVRNIVVKKFEGGKLSKDDIVRVINDIAIGKTSPVMTAYWVAAGVRPGFDMDEILWMTEAMAHSGEMLEFDKPAFDKHSIGGVAGKGITPILVPILANLPGIVVPNTSSKAVTSASATADMLEGIMKMKFSKGELFDMIDKNNVFMVWGGGLDLAPADDKIIRVQKQLGLESFDKLVSSILAKKIAQGIDHVLFDVPIGKYCKVKNSHEADELEELFQKIGGKFGINSIIHRRNVTGIDGHAVGPNLEIREFLKVFEGDKDAPKDIMKEVLRMSSTLIDQWKQYIYPNLSDADKSIINIADSSLDIATNILVSGKADKVLRTIISAQYGNPGIHSTDIRLGHIQKDIHATRDGIVSYINTKGIFDVCRAIGNPHIREAGIYIHKFPGDSVEVGDTLATVYTTTDDRLRLGIETIDRTNIWEYV